MFFFLLLLIVDFTNVLFNVIDINNLIQYIIFLYYFFLLYYILFLLLESLILNKIHISLLIPKYDDDKDDIRITLNKLF